MLENCNTKMFEFDKFKLIVEISDITKYETDCIVNAANKTLLGGGGVDGAIHRAAGKELKEECYTLNGCETGEAKITKAYRLKTKHIIHTVGPVWSGGNNNEDILLGNCYNSSLKIASEHNLKSIAFPCISTGVYRFPADRAAKIALNSVFNFLKNENTSVSICYFSCFDEKNYNIYLEAIKMYL